MRKQGAESARSPPIQCAHSGEVLVAFREVARGLVAFQEVTCHLRRPACAFLLLPYIVRSNAGRFRATTEHRLSFLGYFQ